MFTGIVSDVGVVARVEEGAARRIAVRAEEGAARLAIGASVACDGICLTVVERGVEKGESWFAAELSPETLARTTAGAWKPGTRLNLERALRAGEELGGHIVTGHVDGVATLARLTPEGGCRRAELSCPPELLPCVAPKGSVALNGVSLTVNDVCAGGFSVMLIPHTLAATTWGSAREGEAVNLEIDPLARYVRRLLQASGVAP